MLSDAIAALRCPVCQGTCHLGEGPHRAILCSAGHVFDAAKQGYFNLLTGKGTVFEADSADMVAARQRFLDGGHYAELAGTIASLAAEAMQGPDPAVLDAGTGTGHYLHAVLHKTPATAVGLDISKFALRRAARLNPQAANLVWDIWRPLPLADHSVDVVLVVFAPRNPPEFARVLRPGGTLLVVTPRPGHLAEAAERTGMLSIQEGKEAKLAETLSEHFLPGRTISLDIPLALDPAQLADLAFMGPAGHHLDSHKTPGTADGTESLHTTAKFQIGIFRSRETRP
ncbi:methyltransferase domain-containing protein [Paenarthrobacter sp. NPDC090520]|uniref:methyltransferase domain-containing protein n=1 Tax=Paenarthrobacter sp. NPDC090520 TaxID=3364382 RepID=UPI0037F39B10